MISISVVFLLQEEGIVKEIDISHHVKAGFEGLLLSLSSPDPPKGLISLYPKGYKKGLLLSLLISKPTV